MDVTDLQAIEALGNLMCFYHSDLLYIEKFDDFKKDKIGKEEYLNGNSGFQKFINEYRVARNVPKDNVIYLMLFTKEWIAKENPLEVGKFAQVLSARKLTHDGKIMTSLASKILFLNSPEKIIPIDALNKRAVGQVDNIYSEFLKKVSNFKTEHDNLIKKYLSLADKLLSIVESKHKLLPINFNIYRISRYTDKLLWTKGKNKIDSKSLKRTA